MQKLFLVLFVSLVPRFLAASPPTLDQVIHGLEQIEHKVFRSTSFLVEYERDEAVDLFSSVASGGMLPAHWKQAYSGDKWFNERRFTMRPQDVVKHGGKLTKPTTIVMKAGLSLDWDQSRESAMVIQFKNTNFYNGLNYTRNLSLDAPKFVAMSVGEDVSSVRKVTADNTDLPFLPDYLKANKSRYRVLNEQEVIAGVGCWIVEWPGMDRIAVDSERGFALIQRRYCWGPGKPLRTEATHNDHREVKPGLWLPFEQKEIQYASIVAEKEENWGKPASKMHYKVHQLRFDDLDEKLFEVKLPAKTRVSDEVRNIRYVVSDTDSDPLPNAIASALQQKRSKTFWNIAMWLAVAVVLMVGIALSYKYRRGRSHHAIHW